MSVTFAAELPDGTDNRTFLIVCDSTTAPLAHIVGYAEAEVEAQAHGLLCNRCADYGAEIREEFAEGDPVPVNVANANAVELLQLLGFDLDLQDAAVSPLGDPLPEMVGAIAARLFLDRVDVALSGALDVNDCGTTPLTYRLGDTDRTGAIVHDFGRRPGYLTDRLRQLRDLALACEARGLRVVWD
ncbi:hypothetical protein [Actinoplanes sp. NPDC051859]|uniref:hypothetical protein n=1 Tax=Actinoplanes sp. NPDC051859 TaxID=3363909 RepID=UPI0037AC9C9E